MQNNILPAVKSASVISSPVDRTDIVIIELDAPSPFPHWYSPLTPKLQLNTESGYGVSYCQDVLGIAKELITILKSSPQNFSSSEVV